MAELKQIMFCGLGGQGVVLAGNILGQAAINDKKWVSGSNAYGSQARGGITRSEVVISDEPIKFPHIIKADILVALSQSAYDKYILEINEERGTAVYDKSTIKPNDEARIQQFAIAAVDESIRRLKNEQVANMVMLGGLVAITGIVAFQSLVEAVRQNVPEKYLETNLKAVELGRHLGES